MGEPNPTSPVDDLLARRPNCRTCALERVAEIDRAVARFVELSEDGSTLWSWEAFVAYVVRASWQYPMSAGALRRHAERCRGVRIPR